MSKFQEWNFDESTSISLLVFRAINNRETFIFFKWFDLCVEENVGSSFVLHHMHM